MIASNCSHCKLSKEMSVLDGDDFGESGKAVERLSLEERIIVLFPHLSNDTPYEGLYIECAALL